MKVNGILNSTMQGRCDCPARELAANADYRVIDIKTGAVVSEGKSDECGLVTDPVYEEQPDKVRIHVEYAMDFE
jgi:hypothetical protein